MFVVDNVIGIQSHNKHKRERVSFVYPGTKCPVHDVKHFIHVLIIALIIYCYYNLNVIVLVKSTKLPLHSGHKAVRQTLRQANKTKIPACLLINNLDTGASLIMTRKKKKRTN